MLLSYLKSGGFALPPPRMAPQFCNSFCCFGCSIWRLPMWEAPNLVAARGGGGLGCPLPGFSRRSRLLVQARGKIHSARVKLSGPVLSEPSRTTMYPCMSTFSARNFMQIYALYRGVIWIFCTQVVKNLILGGKQFFSPLY